LQCNVLQSFLSYGSVEAPTPAAATTTAATAARVRPAERDELHVRGPLFFVAVAAAAAAAGSGAAAAAAAARGETRCIVVPRRGAPPRVLAIVLSLSLSLPLPLLLRAPLRWWFVRLLPVSLGRKDHQHHDHGQGQHHQERRGPLIVGPGHGRHCFIGGFGHGGRPERCHQLGQAGIERVCVDDPNVVVLVVVVVLYVVVVVVVFVVVFVVVAAAITVAVAVAVVGFVFVFGGFQWHTKSLPLVIVAIEIAIAIAIEIAIDAGHLLRDVVVPQIRQVVAVGLALVVAAGMLGAVGSTLPLPLTGMHLFPCGIGIGEIQIQIQRLEDRQQPVGIEIRGKEPIGLVRVDDNGGGLFSGAGASFSSSSSRLLLVLRLLWQDRCHEVGQSVISHGSPVGGSEQSL